MVSRDNFTAYELKIMKQSGVDIDLSLSILNDYNAGKTGRTAPLIPKAVPPIDGEQILDLRNPVEYSFTAAQINEFRKRFPEAGEKLIIPGGREKITVSAQTLTDIGNPAFQISLLWISERRICNILCGQKEKPGI